jgi:ketosteroid isomerase-like protein
VRRIWQAWERRDSDAVFALYDPDIECLSTVAVAHIPSVYRGHEGTRRFLGEFMKSFEDFSARAEEFIDAGDSVVVRAQMGGRETTRKVYVEQPLWYVYRLRGGRVVRIEIYTDRAEALEAVALVE